MVPFSEILAHDGVIKKRDKKIVAGKLPRNGENETQTRGNDELFRGKLVQRDERSIVSDT